MFLYVALWRPRPAWLLLSESERIDHIVQLGLAMHAPAEGIELLACVARDVTGGEFGYCAVWKLPEAEHVVRLERSLDEVGWGHYFETTSAGAQSAPLESLLAEMAMESGDPAASSTEEERDPMEYDEAEERAEDVLSPVVESAATVVGRDMPEFSMPSARSLGGSIDVDEYLARIGYDGSLEPTIETLRALHLSHLIAVPFENLDIARRTPIVLDERAFFEKIVRGRRGGFCYELNGLFAALLRELGYRVTLLSASVAQGDGTTGPEYDHLALMVRLEERWLVDVGFGDSFRHPLLLDSDEPQTSGGVTHRVVSDGRVRRMMKQVDSGWRLQYTFTLLPRALEEFAGMCDYHQTSPHSHFTRGSICSRMTEDGSISLSDNRLVVVRNGERVERPIAGRTEFAGMLAEHFGM